jgi:hypothetical protein
MPRACPVESHVICYTPSQKILLGWFLISCSCDRETPRDKPVASLNRWLESGIDGLALEGEYTEDAFVDAA